MESFHVLLAFFLTFFAGLSTGIGSLIAFIKDSANPKFLSSTLGFSAGVMIYVSFVEIFAKAKESLIQELGPEKGTWTTILAFFVGMALIAIIDKIVPSYENPHEAHRIDSISDSNVPANYQKLYRMGIFTALAITIHNFPEGLATFTASLKDPSIGIPIALAIAIHNIPEGIAVSVPLFYATGSRKKSFVYSFLSGLSEPCGALIGYFILMPFFNDFIFGFLFAAVAGIMVFISLDELLPTAEEYGQHHLAIYSLLGGMVVMTISLALFL